MSTSTSSRSLVDSRGDGRLAALQPLETSGPRAVVVDLPCDDANATLSSMSTPCAHCSSTTWPMLCWLATVRRSRFEDRRGAPGRAGRRTSQPGSQARYVRARSLRGSDRSRPRRRGRGYRSYSGWADRECRSRSACPEYRGVCRGRIRPFRTTPACTWSGRSASRASQRCARRGEPRTFGRQVYVLTDRRHHGAARRPEGDGGVSQRSRRGQSTRIMDPSATNLQRLAELVDHHHPLIAAGIVFYLAAMITIADQRHQSCCRCG